MRFLLDTCVISELVAKRPDPGVVQWIDDVGEEKIYLSALTIGEIKKEIAKLRLQSSLGLYQHGRLF